MARAADAISTGNMALLDLPANGKDEVATLARAFNRLRRSVEKAMKMIGE
jgi:protein-histidine pros-kinase